jgi:D-cysteine desulfhydrase family pyridoxal phosphate-dependent enzyme
MFRVLISNLFQESIFLISAEYGGRSDSMKSQIEHADKQLSSQERIHLCTLPTPIERPVGLQTLVPSINLLVKRDDVMELAMGGNKVRKLEFLMADARSRSCDTVVTTGDLHSNHTRLTAAAARRLGMRPVLAMKGKRPESIQGNLLLGYLLGADVRFFDVERKELPSIMEDIRKEQEANGHRCYVIPRGGASAHGVLGYANAIFEIRRQLADTAEKLDYVVFATGTGATQAGLLLGTKLARIKAKVVGISAGRSESEIAGDVSRLVGEAAKLLGVNVQLSSDEIIVNDSYTCGGYGVVTKEVTDLMETIARKEGLLVDPVYTGKGMLGLLGLAKQGYFPNGSHVLFIHTGGLPIIFSHWQPPAHGLEDN